MKRKEKIDSLGATALISFSAMLGFLSVYRRAESTGNLSTQVDSWIRDRTTMYQSNSITLPTGIITFDMPSGYVGEADVEVSESVNSSGIPVEYSGLKKMTIAVNWTTDGGQPSNRSITFLVYQP